MRIEATIRGVVQGVSFRYFTRLEAQALGLSGWVANRQDGSVEIVAEGPEEDIQKMIAFLHSGPPGARVDTVDVSWREAKSEFDGFYIRR